MKPPLVDLTKPLPVVNSGKSPLNVPSSYWMWVSALPVCCYFACVALMSVNVPQNDDFQSILHDIAQYDTTPDKVDWFMAQYVDHRLAFVRLAGLIWQRMTGSLNFTAMNLLGCLGLFGVLWLLAQWFRRQQALHLFLPVPFILLILNYHHNMFISMAAIQNIWVLFWAALTIWWIADRRGWRPWAALVSAMLCVGTSSSGLLLPPLIVALLAWQCRWRLMLVWLLASSAVTCAYLWQLAFGPDRTTPAFLLAHLPQVGAFVIFFLGSYADLLPNVLQRASVHSNSLLVRSLFYLRLLFPFVLGLLMLGGGLLICLRWWLSRSGVRQWMRRLPGQYVPFGTPAATFIVGMVLFVLLTAILVAAGRVQGGIAQSFSIRYKVYSPLLVVFLYAFMILNGRTAAYRQRLYRITLAGGVLIWLNSYGQHLSQIQHNRHVAVAGLFNWQTNGTWAVYGGLYGNIDEVIRQAVQNQSYIPDTTLLGPCNNLTDALRQPQATIAVAVDSTAAIWGMRAPQLPVTWSYWPSSAADGGYFVLYNPQHTYLIPALIDRDAFGRQTSGQWAYVERTTHGLAPATYQLAVLVIQGKERHIYQTDKKLRLY